MFWKWKKMKETQKILFSMAMDRLIAVRQRYNNSRSNHQILRFVPVSFLKKEQPSNEWFDGKKCMQQKSFTYKFSCQIKVKVLWIIETDDLLFYQPIKFFFSHGKQKVYLCTYVWNRSWKRLVYWIWPNFDFWQS